MTNPQEFPNLYKYGKNLTEKFRNSKEIVPIIGRELETRKAVSILLQKFKNNLILVGFPGVGKSALIEGIAQKIASGNITDSLKDKELWEIDLALLSSKDESDGGFQIRMKELIKEIENSGGKVIPFIDEFHTIMGAGASTALDAANILKPALARGTLRMIGATTFWEYHKFLEKDGAMTRRFGKVILEEPTKKQAEAILKGRKRLLEIYHGVTISDDAIKSAVEYSVRYIPSRYLPDKAIDILDQSAASTRLSIDSMPEDLDLLQNKIALLEADLKSEKDKVNIVEIKTQLLELKPELDYKIKQWREQKEALEFLKNFRIELERLNKELTLEDAKGKDKNLTLIGELTASIKEKEKNLAEFKSVYKSLNPIIDDEVTEAAIAKTIESLTGIPVSQISANEMEKMRNLENNLHKRVIGQNKAVAETAYAIKRARLGLGDPSQPIGSFLFLGPTGVGKALLDTTIIPTPEGEKMLKDIKVSDYVFSRQGTPTKVLGVFPQKEKLNVHIVTFEDGRVSKCCENHLFSYFNTDGEFETKSVKDIMKLNYQSLCFPNNDPVEYNKFSISEKELITLYQSILQVGLIPKVVKYSSIENRVELLRMLLNDSFVKPKALAYSSNQIDLVKDVKELCYSLGILTGKIEKIQDNYSFELYNIPKELELSDLNRKDNCMKIVSITETDEYRKMTCILVENEEHLFLTEDYVVTHNTELVKALAETMFGDEKNMKRFDMGEFKSPKSLSRLIGAPPGEDVNDTGGELTEWGKNNPYSVILFDEAEKAHYSVFDLLLSVLDDGELTDSRGDKVDFTNNLIILTSNIGAQEILRGVDKQTGDLEPQTIRKVHASLRNPDTSRGGKGFRPEFINRIDSIVFFLPLTLDDTEKIATLKLKSLKKRVLKSRNIRLVFSEKKYETLKEDQPPRLDVSYWLSRQLDFEELKLGGRPINRYIRTEIEDKLVDFLMNGLVEDGAHIYIEATYPEGDKFYVGTDGQTRPVPPIIKFSEISEKEYNKLILVDPVEEDAVSIITR